jgi:hypothetical protein
MQGVLWHKAEHLARWIEDPSADPEPEPPPLDLTNIVENLKPPPERDRTDSAEQVPSVRPPAKPNPETDVRMEVEEVVPSERPPAKPNPESDTSSDMWGEQDDDDMSDPAGPKPKVARRRKTDKQAPGASEQLQTNSVWTRRLPS